MSVTPALLISGVRASMQLYGAGDRALARHVRDRALGWPHAMMPLPQNPITIIRRALRDEPEFRAVLVQEGLLVEAETYYDATSEQQQVWLPLLSNALSKHNARKDHPELTDTALEEWRQSTMIAQWDENDPQANPLEPWQEFAVAFGKVASEFIGTNPSVLQIGGDGERLIGAFATTTKAMLEDATFTDKQFGAQLLSVVVRSGLQTLSDERTLLFDEDHVAELVGKVTAPILDKLKNVQGNVVAAREWRALALEFIGPVSDAAFGALASNQQAFLGDNFAAEELLGKLTTALLTELESDDLAQLFPQPGGGDPTRQARHARALALRLFQSVAGVAAAHPELIVKGTDDLDVVFRSFLRKVASEIVAANGVDKALALDIVVAGLAGLSEATPELVSLGLSGDTGNAWEAAAEQIIQHVLAGLSQAATGQRSIQSLASRPELIALARIFFDQVARTPRMIAGNTTELEAVVAAIARGMADESNALLTSTDWRKIAAVAAREAGQNPGRLFGLDSNGDAPGAQVLSELLGAAADALALDTPTARGNVLFGETLRIAIEIALKAVSGDTLAGRTVLSKAGQLRLLAQQISVVVATTEDNVLQYGAREWLALWRAELPRLLESGGVLEPLATILTPLGGAPTMHGQTRIAAVIGGTPMASSS